MNKKQARKKRYKKASAKRCGLCGSTEKTLTRTDCCGNLICDDAHEYVAFSYDTNSCFRNHMRYTVCASHYNEGHRGNWKDCQDCLEFTAETEMYVWYATNEFNFEVLQNPPAFEPTKCSGCGQHIVLTEEPFTKSAAGYFCMECGG